MEKGRLKIFKQPFLLKRDVVEIQLQRVIINGAYDDQINK